MRIDNTVLKSLNKNRLTTVCHIPGKITVWSDEYIDLILEVDKFTKEGWKVQYEYSKKKYKLFGKKHYYVLLKK